ncbi:MAG TPA: DNA polymerase III subunit gamma/tau, partial [Myxococcales bacterium]|nr:DNA polymerase III subunit gamma/tau [Myxococcales bacterium]
MSTPYLVLARKYRPQRFADLTGQEHVVRTLTNALKSGRVAHAFLFTGPRGCGKTTSARILARALNCEKGPTPEPCGVCGPCVDIAAGSDMDVQEIDAASNNGVDDVRALREAAKFLPGRDRYKIYIVDEVHMLSSAAFNALLKTLEEPPGHIKFLLATTDPQKLPATILSRVQRHNIQLVPLSKIVARLREIAQAENVQASDGALSMVARQAQGSMRDALSLLDQLFSAHDPAAGEISDAEAAETLGALDTAVVRETVQAILARDAGGALQGVVKAYEQGADMKRLAEELASHARNLVLASLPGVKQDLPDHELRALAQEAKEHDGAQLARVFELLQLAQDEVAKAASPRHALEVALLRAVHLAP